MSLSYSMGSGHKIKYRIPGTNKYVSRSRVIKIINDLGFTAEEYYAIFIAKFKKDMFGNIIYPKCPQCGKKREFYKFSNPYPNIHCGKSCRMKREQNDKSSFWHDEERMKRKRESAKRGALTLKLRRSKEVSSKNYNTPFIRIRGSKSKMRWYSKISFELFSNISLKLKELGFNHEVFYGENEYSVSGLDKRITKGNGRRYLDFYCPFNNLVIEFNGDYWHGSAQDKLNDISREFQLRAAGFNNIVTVGESEYRSNKDKITSDLVDLIISTPESYRVQMSNDEIDLYFKDTFISCNGEVSYSYRNSEYSYTDSELMYDEVSNRFYRMR